MDADLDDFEQDENWDDWEDNNEEVDETKCLFCESTFPNPNLAFNHLKDSHGFDFARVRVKFGLDEYGCIKLINYIRKTNATPESILSLPNPRTFVESDDFLRPILENDPLLYAFDDEDDELMIEPQTQPQSSELADLAKKLRETEERAKVAELAGQRIMEAFNQYKEMVKQTYLDPKISIAIEPKLDSDYYFESYAGLEIHETMLKDSIRTDAYRDFISGNPEYFNNKIVLDVGCGTGILSMFAAKAGAKHVFAVDNSSIIKKAKEIARRNGFEDKITFIEGAVEQIELPVDTVDIIVSEWMGYFLLYESMLDSVFTARDRYLAPNGIMAPSQADILLCAIDDSEWKYDRYHFWESVYGFDMSPMQDKFTEIAHIEVTRDDKAISDSACIASINTNTATVEMLDFSSDFTLNIKSSGSITAFAGWFDIVFEGEGAKTVKFTTSPFWTATHWKQTLFVLNQELKVESGDVIKGWIECVKSKNNHRELVVTIKYGLSGQEFEQVFHVR